MQQGRLSLSAVQVIASVLAAVTGAVAASSLGIAGTIIGAAVVSFASTVGTALYRHVLGRTRDRLRSAASSEPSAGDDGQAGTRPAAQLRQQAVRAAARLERLRGAAADTGPPGPGGRSAPRALAELRESAAGSNDPATAAGGGDRAARRRRRRWLILAGAIAGTFAATMALITGIELAVGKPLDAIFWHRHNGGTTVGDVVRGHDRPAGPATRPPGTPPAPHPARSSPPVRHSSPASPRPSRASPSPTPPAPSPTVSQTPPPTPTPGGASSPSATVSPEGPAAAGGQPRA